ncbi:MAG: amylo-alpha-1,6-glucosidase, partial [Caulobacteraceae bacterium]
AQSGKRRQSAPIEEAWTKAADGGEVAFRYGHPDLAHACLVRFSGPGRFTHQEGLVSCTVALDTQQTQTLSIDVVPVFCGERIEPMYGLDGALAGESAADAVLEEWEGGCARLAVSNPIVQSAWDRAAADLGALQLLEGEAEERFTPAAGVPKYIALFGRDTLMSGLQSALLNPATLRGSIRLLAKWNAETYDDAYDAQPGRVLHQRQLSPLALLGEQPLIHYYGDYSAPGLFLLGLAAAFAQSGDKAIFLSMREKALATLEWMDRDGDVDHDGFYEYQTRAGERGTKNQGWKDSDQAILTAEGRMVEDPIAVCEIQGLYFAAKQAMGAAFEAAGEPERGAELLSQASELKRRFNQRFWMEEEGFLALALDPQKRQVKSIASNAGACLAYGIVDADKAQAIAERLMGKDMYSGWGIRTLSSEHPAYNPLAYHLGTVWPFANALTGLGLKRYGFSGAQHRLAKGLFGASQVFHLDRLPEVFGGHPRDARHPHSGVYPGACAPQAWSASAVVLLIHTMLGLFPLAPMGVLIVDPDLPDWLAEVRIEGVRVGDAQIDLAFRRDEAGRTDFEVLAIRGSDIRIGRLKGELGPGEDRFEAAIRQATG